MGLTLEKGKRGNENEKKEYVWRDPFKEEKRKKLKGG